MSLDFEKLIEERLSIASQGDPFDPFKILPEGTKWKNFGSKGPVLVEEAFFLYGLVRMTKPSLILDCGTYIGVAAIFMAQALRDNGHGGIISVECNDSNYRAAQRVFAKLGFGEIILHHSYMKDFSTPEGIDFLFLDTETAERVEQFHQLFPFLAEDAWAVFHDAGACEGIETIRWPYLHFKTVREMRVYHIERRV